MWGSSSRVGYVVLLLALLFGITAPPARAQDPTHGISLVADEVLSEDGRLHELTLRSVALLDETKVRILLPAGYDDPASAATRYPMLLLLHGAGDSEATWTRATEIEELTQDLDLITVMPDADRGFYSDWRHGPKWETYHLRELLPWLDATFRTVGTREGRAVAGLSMGGLGSMGYAARHPDLFSAAAAFSGAVDIADLNAVEAAALTLLGLTPANLWGTYIPYAATWHGHNPADLASNLRWTNLRMTSGTGVPCPGDNPASGIIEAGTGAMTFGFSTRLQVLDIPHSVELRPCGTHEWHYWEADLAQWLPTMMSVFASPPARPDAFDHRFVEPSVSVWGWTFTAHRPATEFLDLEDVSAAGLRATGSGLVDIATAPRYDPGATYDLTSTSAGVITVPVALLPRGATLPSGAPTRASAVADADGRLHFTVDLGPAHTVDQYSPEGLLAEAAAVGSYFHTVEVAITPATVASPAEPPPTSPPATSSATSGRTLPATGIAPAPWTAIAAAVGLATAVRRLVRAAHG